MIENNEYFVEIKNKTILNAIPKNSSILPLSPMEITGKKTIKGLLKTALLLAGKVLYVYGGGWSFQDNGSAIEAKTLGIQKEWENNFNRNNESYNYKYISGTKNSIIDKAKSHYPFGGFNQYHYEGLDCSGYLGWVIYNTLNKSENNKGYVFKASAFAKALEEQGFGTFKRNLKLFKSGDIVSIRGHVWLCVGVCSDKSIILIHSTPSKSRIGEMGGGVQLSALNPLNTKKSCIAYETADFYMKKNCKKWYERYNTKLLPYNIYTDFSAAKDLGVFSWDIKSFCTDIENYQNKTADEILKDIDV